MNENRQDNQESRPTGKGETKAVQNPPEPSSELADLLDRFLEELQAGRQPNRAQWLGDHPSLAPQLEEALAGLEFIHGAGTGSVAAPAQLGDFRIVREVGRGGMGVVYEAEQLSLHRRVALKVLTVGAVVDPIAMQRFQREAETVAQLHHTNIVPVFAVGCEQGVRYYAMQFIQGQNLAELAEADQAGTRRIPFAELADWGLQAAEAIAHAHERGVIHRDIKPSNLILDPDSRIWLTDFGLARRFDDVTLSLTGALLGTPRYMSPEQARAAIKAVDHRTDIYSLGATLYELATRSPIFDAPSPHAVLNQILNDEPAPPRRLRPELPRDLETIILKCLAKDPVQRYSTARALADDLRAFLEGRAIRARRPSLPEQALRWARKNRRSTSVAAVSAALSLSLLAAGWGGWTLWSRAQLGQVTLKTGEALLEGEVLKADADQLVMPAFSLPTKQALPLPKGAYRVRLSAQGRLSQTLDLKVHRGESREYNAGLARREFFDPLPITLSDSIELAKLQRTTDILTARMWEMRRVDGATGKEVWRVGLQPQDHRRWWHSEAQRHGWSQFFDRRRNGARLALPPPDLNGDAVGDLVWASEVSPSLLAVSGKDGQILWWHAGQWPSAANLPPDAVFNQWSAEGTCRPVVAEVDGDGTPDLLMTFSTRGWHWIEAISGKTGSNLWQRTLDSRWFKSPSWTSQEITPTPQLVQLKGQQVVVLAATLRLLVLSLGTGQTILEHELTNGALADPQIADLDADGADDLLLVGDRGYRMTSLTAFSITQNKRLWEKALAAGYETYSEEPERLDWPVVKDLDHDGKLEIIVPSCSASLPTPERHQSAPWAGLDVLNAQDGSLRFHKVMQHTPRRPVSQVNRFITGPDIDGDGTGDIFAAATITMPQVRNAWLYLDAISGQNGSSLWWWRTPLQSWNDTPGVLTWWQNGPDSHPMLTLSAVTWPKKGKAIYVFETGSGRLLHTIPGAFSPQAMDVDADGLPDLAYRTSPGSEIRYGQASQVILRGASPTMWARLNPSFFNVSVFSDLDRDGFEDILQGSPVAAFSGATGQPLWRTSHNDREFFALHMPEGDLDGDGSPDLVTVQSGVSTGGSFFFEPVTAVSGKTGRDLWKAALSTQQAGFLHLLEQANLDGSGSSEIVLMMGIGLDRPVRSQPYTSSQSNQLWLIVLSAANGSLLWQTPLTEPFLQSDSDRRIPPAIGDLNGDGVKDIVAGALTPSQQWEVRAFEGSSGKLLWQHPLSPPRRDNLHSRLRQQPQPIVGDLDADGAPEVVLVEYVRDQPGTNGFNVACALLVLDGRTGQTKWTWIWAELTDEPRTTPLLVNLRGGKQYDICLLTGHFDWSELVLLDCHGQVVERTKSPIRMGPGKLWHADLDGDAREELLHLSGEGLLRVTRGGLRQVLWEQRVDQVFGPRIRSGETPVVVAQRGRHLLGVAGSTGNVLWRGEPPAPGTRPVLVAGAPAHNPPWSVRAGSGSMVCEQLLPTLASGEYRGHAEGQHTALRHLLDPRLERPLPWNYLEGGPGVDGAERLHQTTRRLLVENAILALILALPAALVWWICKKFHGWPRVLLASCVILLAGLVVASLTTEWKQLVPNLTWRPILGSPTVLFIWACLAASWQRRWSRLIGLFSLAAGFSILLGGAWFLSDVLARLPDEFYSAQGWYFVLLFGAYTSGFVLLLNPLARKVWKRVRQGAHNRLPATA